MRRLHGHRTFTDMTNSIRPSFDSARNEKQGMNGTIIRLAIRKRFKLKHQSDLFNLFTEIFEKHRLSKNDSEKSKTLNLMHTCTCSDAVRIYV